MLLDYGCELSNNGCNDLSDDMTEIINQFQHDELKEIFGEQPTDYDWIVAKAIGRKLLRLSDEL